MAMVSGGDRADVIQVRPKLIRDLLRASPTSTESPQEDGWRVTVGVQPNDSLNKVAVECERQYFVQLYIREKGDFSAMARVLLGDPEHARKVQLRFNQLGLKVRELKAQLR
jgi:two-component system nitrogen regulation response regulator GlnG